MAESYFRETLKEIRKGRTFVTDWDEIAVRYEIAMMLDAQSKLHEALDEFTYVRDNSPSDSYYVMDASYETARISLELWLTNPTTENKSYLTSAADQFRRWIARDWNKLTTKLWGYYHGVCSYRQKKLMSQNGELDFSKDDNELLKSYTDNFLFLARSQKGVRKYELRYSAFVLTGKSYERFPGEPLRCGLDDLLAEFEIH